MNLYTIFLLSMFIILLAGFGIYAEKYLKIVIREMNYIIHILQAIKQKL